MKDRELFTKKGLDGVGGALVGVVSVVLMSGVLVLYVMGLRELQQKTYASVQTRALAKLISNIIQIEPTTGSASQTLPAQTDNPNELLRTAVSQTLFPRSWILSFQYDEVSGEWKLFLESGNRNPQDQRLRNPGTKYEYILENIKLKEKNWPFSETVTRYGKTLSKDVRFVTASYEGFQKISGTSNPVKILVVVMST